MPIRIRSGAIAQALANFCSKGAQRRSRSTAGCVPLLAGLVWSACGEASGPSGTQDRVLHASFTGITLATGDTLQLGVTLEDGRENRSYPIGSDGSPAEDFIDLWASGNPQVVEVTSSGLLRARGAGRTTVRIEVDDLTRTIDVAVRPVPGTQPMSFGRISVGGAHTCALGSEGRAFCWGSRWFGELGTGVAERFSWVLSPVPVTGNERFVAIAAAIGHTCALDAAGQAYCWGQNDRGQLGDGTSRNRAAPAPIRGDQRFVQLAAADSHSCGLTADGRAFCWGWNTEGQLGVGSPTGTSDYRTEPLEVSGGISFTSLAAGVGRTCGIAVDKRAYCWGGNTFGELGTGRSEPEPTPAAVAGSLHFATLAGGTGHTCGVTSVGEPFCWGKNDLGQLGTGDESWSSVPAPVAGEPQFSTVVAGFNHSCGVTSSGIAYCWGSNWEGQLGTGTGEYGKGESIPVPTPVAGSLRFAMLSAAENHTCGVTIGGDAYCWGGGIRDFGGGAVGDGTARRSIAPQRVTEPLF